MGFLNLYINNCNKLAKAFYNTSEFQLNDDILIIGIIYDRKNFYKSLGIIHYWVNFLDAEKPTLFFLPGLTADHRLFEKQIEPIYFYYPWKSLLKAGQKTKPVPAFDTAKPGTKTQTFHLNG